MQSPYRTGVLCQNVPYFGTNFGTKTYLRSGSSSYIGSESMVGCRESYDTDRLTTVAELMDAFSSSWLPWLIYSQLAANLYGQLMVCSN